MGIHWKAKEKRKREAMLVCGMWYVVYCVLMLICWYGDRYWKCGCFCQLFGKSKKSTKESTIKEKMVILKFLRCGLTICNKNLSTYKNIELYTKYKISQWKKNPKKVQAQEKSPTTSLTTFITTF